MVDRLPPPPFWRRRYFAEIVVTKPQRHMTPIEIAATLAAPTPRDAVRWPDPVLALVFRSRPLAAGRDACRW